MATAPHLKTVTRLTEQEVAAPVKVQLPQSGGLSFQPKLLGFHQGRLNERTVGGWQIELIKPSHPMPKRAQARLQEFLASGVEVTQIALYHELPPEPSVFQKAAAQTIIATKAALPFLGRLAMWGAVGLLGLVAVAGLVAVMALAGATIISTLYAAGIGLGTAIVGALGGLCLAWLSGVDPVLVVQTKAGTWLELDRWND